MPRFGGNQRNKERVSLELDPRDPAQADLIDLIERIREENQHVKNYTTAHAVRKIMYLGWQNYYRAAVVKDATDEVVAMRQEYPVRSGRKLRASKPRNRAPGAVPARKAPTKESHLSEVGDEGSTVEAPQAVAVAAVAVTPDAAPAQLAAPVAASFDTPPKASTQIEPQVMPSDRYRRFTMMSRSKEVLPAEAPKPTASMSTVQPKTISAGAAASAIAKSRMEGREF